MDAMIERVRRLVAHLPGVEPASSWGRDALKVGGKGLAWVSREPGALALPCPLELKEHLIEARPDLFFETDHYRGWPTLLVRMDAIDDETLSDRLDAAWMDRAPKKLLRQRQAQTG